MEYVCPLCHSFSTYHKSVMKKHLQRNSPCSNVSHQNMDNIFNIMNKTNVELVNMVINANQSQQQLQSTINQLQQEKSQLQQENSTLRTENNLMKTIINYKDCNVKKVNDVSVSGTKNKTTINDNSTINANTTTYVINLFEKENTDYIHVPNYLQEEDDIVRLVKDVHFNEHHPENQNVKFENGKAKIFKIPFNSSKKQWKTMNTEDVLSDLVMNGERIMTEYDIDLLSKDQLDVMESISDIIGKYNNNKFTESLKNELGLP